MLSKYRRLSHGLVTLAVCANERSLSESAAFGVIRKKLNELMPKHHNLYLFSVQPRLLLLALMLTRLRERGTEMGSKGGRGPSIAMLGAS